MTPSPRGKVENEVTLVVTSDDPAETLKRIGALREIAGYTLRPRGVEDIRDTYLDTPDESLGARRVALRTREQGANKKLVTLKGPSSSAGSAGSKRSELELPLGPRSIARIRKELARLGIASEPVSGEVDRKDLKSSLGLREVQKRRTRRLVRDVVPPGSAGSKTVAELAMDQVEYELGRKTVRLAEVEIEAKGPGGAAAVDKVAVALLARFPDDLQRWDHSKLATGKKLADWLKRRKLEGKVGPNKLLKRSAFALLDRALAGS